MRYHVGTLEFDDWCSLRLDQGWSDTFVFCVSANSGLPPMDFARILKRILPPLAKLRRGASVWVRVDAPGRWYANELRRAMGRTPCPVAVTCGDTPPDASLFSFTVRQSDSPMPPPPKIKHIARKDHSRKLSLAQLKVLRVLARIKSGTAAEIGSLAGVTEKTALGALRTLVDKKMAEFMEHPPRKRPNRQVEQRRRQAIKNYRQRSLQRKNRPLSRKVIFRKGSLPGLAVLTLQLARLRKLRKKQFRTQPRRWWRISRHGKSAALRSWGIPVGVSFQAGRERDYLPGWRHVRTSRLAPAWLKHDGQAKVMGGWSEVSVPGYRVVPDALLWAMVQGEETLVWVEVQGGNKPREMNAFLRRMRLRFKRASEYARYHRVRLVFLVLGKPWAVQALRGQLPDLRQTEAVLLQTWLRFGELPKIIWGAMQSGDRMSYCLGL